MYMDEEAQEIFNKCSLPQKLDFVSCVNNGVFIDSPPVLCHFPHNSRQIGVYQWLSALDVERATSIDQLEIRVNGTFYF